MDGMSGVGTLRVAGVDEAGRGCLAGPVFAAAVILRPRQRFRGLDDSKKVPRALRETLFARITDRAWAWSVASASVEEIDRHNILQATFIAMRRAVEALVPAAEHCLVDGNRLPPLACPATAIVDGDALHSAIMAASILAKVSRDRELARLEELHPGYGFARHKGYGTPAHLDALRRLGPCGVHRMSFAPCRGEPAVPAVPVALSLPLDA